MKSLQVSFQTGLSRLPCACLGQTKYSEDYLKFGFTALICSGTEKPQCVLCCAVLSAESVTELKTQASLGLPSHTHLPGSKPH